MPAAVSRKKTPGPKSKNAKRKREKSGSVDSTRLSLSPNRKPGHANKLNPKLIPVAHIVSLDDNTDSSIDDGGEGTSPDTPVPDDATPGCSKSIIAGNRGIRITIKKKVEVTKRIKKTITTTESESTPIGNLFQSRHERTCYSLRQRDLKQGEMMHLQQNGGREYNERLMELEFEKQLKEALIASTWEAVKKAKLECMIPTSSRVGSGRCGRRRRLVKSASKK